jgi:hypothetical protein
MRPFQNAEVEERGDGVMNKKRGVAEKDSLRRSSHQGIINSFKSKARVRGIQEQKQDAS